MATIRRLDENLQEKAVKELNEDPQRVQEACDYIKQWLQKQPHLSVRKDDQFLIAFLRGCKWNLQKVKEKLNSFYSVKSSIPDFFKNRDPFSLELQKVLKAGAFFVLPKVDNYFGPVVLVYNLRNVDSNETPLTVVIKLFFMSLEILMREDDNFVVSGISLIADHSNCPTSYYLQFTPTVMQNHIKCLHTVYPIRIKSISIINTVAVFEKLYNTIIKPFFSRKLQERMNVFSSEESEICWEAFPRNLLPEEYGGTNGSLKSAAEKWKNKVESYKEWFLEDDNFVTNENLRLKDTNCYEDGIGTDGTFRNLVID